jgi:carboxyl-terminal processing protease
MDWLARFVSPAPAPLQPLEQAAEQAKELAAEVTASAQAAVKEIRPLQVASGAAVALFITGAAVVGAGNAVSDFLVQDPGYRTVLERTLIFGEILEDVKDTYFDKDVDIDKLFETGANAMLNSLDPFSSYENPSEAEDMAIRTTGSYGGVGLTIGREKPGEGGVVVIQAQEGFAFDAGVRAGDRILAVGEKRVGDLSTDKVRDLLRGEPGTTVDLLLQRDWLPEEIRLKVPRARVQLPDVTLAAINDGIGYMKVEGFSEHTAQETEAAIRKFEEATASSGGLKGLILDLRGNPGGLLDAAVGVAQQLVPKGQEIVSTTGRGTELSYRSTKPPILNPSTRLVVLVDADTASAAEIVSGVVQDTDRGVVLGRRTYGKGLVQVVAPLPGGGSLKLTVARYFTPSGRCIQALTYGGGRIEAAKPPASEPDAEGADGKAAEKRDAKKSREEDLRTPGALLRLDASDPSFPRAATDETEYRSRKGRPLRGGGGIAPDVIVENRKPGKFELILVNQGVYSQFATQWLKAHQASSSEELVERVLRGEDAIYREFTAFVKEKMRGKDNELLGPGLKAQLAALKKALPETALASKQELEVLRTRILADLATEMEGSRKELQEDMREALLIRLEAPSKILAARIREDPQVQRARSLAADAAAYEKILAAPAPAKKAMEAA